MNVNTFHLNDHFILLLAIVTGVMASARFVRLVTADKFPPVVKFRMWWDSKTEGDNPDEGWGVLFHCLWCFAPWVVAANLAWALLSDLQVAWWVCNGWLAASYVTSWLVFHDED